MKKLFVILCSFLVCSYCNAQGDGIDYLLRVIQNRGDSARKSGKDTIELRASNAGELVELKKKYADGFKKPDGSYYKIKYSLYDAPFNPNKKNEKTAGKEVTDYVVVPPTVQVNAQLAKVDTFLYTIGRADFRIEGKRRAVPAEVFIDMNPHGITLRRMGVDMTTPIKAGLVAPLHLPAGAVIRKVEFNYILLQGGGSVPHLVLRSYYLDNNGGWGSNKPITSYWLNSPSLNTSTGYDVKSSVTAPGFNVPVNKKATQYFEILAGSASSTATPMESSWPASNPFFIWSINVYYTLN